MNPHGTRETSGCTSVLDAWTRAIADCSSRGVAYRDQDGEPCREIASAAITVQDATDADALVTALRESLPYPYPSVEELRAHVFIPLRTATPTFADALVGAERQLEGYVIPLLRAHPETRRAVATTLDPAQLTSGAAGAVPSLLSLHWRRDEKLHITAHFRSVDAFLGLPANLAELASVNAFVAERTGTQPGTITIFASSLHLIGERDTGAIVAATRRTLGRDRADTTGKPPQGI